jgi:predicted nucleic acid-binding protein
MRTVEFSKSSTNPIITTAWVLTEVGDALAAPPQRSKFVALLAKLRADPYCEVVPTSEASFKEGVVLYSNRLDKSWTLTDCISFALMTRRRLTEALTTDIHFEQAGFKALLR